MDLFVSENPRGLPAKYIEQAHGDFAKAWRTYRAARGNEPDPKRKRNEPDPPRSHHRRRHRRNPVFSYPEIGKNSLVNVAGLLAANGITNLSVTGIKLVTTLTNDQEGYLKDALRAVVGVVGAQFSQGMIGNPAAMKIADFVLGYSIFNSAMRLSRTTQATKKLADILGALVQEPKTVQYIPPRRSVGQDTEDTEELGRIRTESPLKGDGFDKEYSDYFGG